MYQRYSAGFPRANNAKVIYMREYSESCAAAKDFACATAQDSGGSVISVTDAIRGVSAYELLRFR